MAELTAPLVLASASPRRREILDRLGLSFEVVPSEVVETGREGESPVDYVCRLSVEKADSVAAALAARAPAPFVLGADTTVVLGDEVLDKPQDDEEARSMIARLSGRQHSVVTGVSLVRSGVGRIETISVETLVTFRALTDATIDGYVASGEGRDKAGAYGIQGIGSGLVAHVNGCYFNVVGLPAAAVVSLLEGTGAVSRWP